MQRASYLFGSAGGTLAAKRRRVIDQMAAVHLLESFLRARNEAILDRVNASGRALVSHTDLKGRYALRVAIGNAATTAEHVDRAWELIRTAA